MLTAEYLRTRLFYDPSTGIFTWKLTYSDKVSVGEMVGRVQKKGSYRRITIDLDCKQYRAHRLAWLYVYGEWPPKDIDHINGDSTDNRITNLRLASDSQNLGNMRKPATNKSGRKGVSWHSIGKKWQAHIRVEGINHYLGLFPTVEAASAAYAAKAIELRGEFARWE